MALDQPAAPPLCVDLDGTLTAGDSTVRLGLRLVLAKPWLAPAFPLWDHRSRAYLKQEIARRARFDAARFPYNRALLPWLRQEKSEGRRLVLASGSDYRIVAAVDRHLDLFDEFLSSDGTINLAGEHKAAALAARYGTFDYIGNSRKDVAVWRRARTCYLVADGTALAAALARQVAFARVFPGDWGAAPG